MFQFRIALFLALVVGVSCTKKEAVSTMEIIKTEGGLVKGSLANGVYSFKGVPFAAPPINDLRWKAPQPVKPWTDTLACVSFGASPIQSDPKPFMMWTEEFIAPPKPLSEDCLFVNVWTAAKSNKDKLPVLVWIYGGAFRSGSSACAVYDGEELAKQGIVYVSLNYRLGVFGFLAHPELTAESPNKSSGNYGLMDQIAALQWVKNNIAAFGGDPERVTIAGQSAGAFSVSALVASPLAKNLFVGAIAESGAMTGQPAVALKDAEKTGLILSQKLKSEKMDVLRSLSADSLLALGNTVSFGYFPPVTDGYVLPTDVKTILDNKQHNDVPILAGWVTGDADLALREEQTPAKFKSEAQAKYGNKSAEFLKLFPAENNIESKQSQLKAALMGLFAFPDYTWARSNSHNSYLYVFTHVPVDKPDFPNYGAFHTAEVPFALHTLKHWDRPWRGSDYKVETYMSSYWLNFVKTGNPNGTGLPEWKKYDGTGSIMEMGDSAIMRPGYYQKEFEFLEASKH